MSCHYCTYYKNGKRTPDGRLCDFKGKVREKSQEIPTNKKGELCKGFTFCETIWCETNQHYKNYQACLYNFRANDDCKGCLQNEEVIMALEIHRRNHKAPFERRKFVMLKRRTKLIQFKRRSLLCQKNV